MKAVELKYSKKCELMTLSMQTQMEPSGNLFAHVEAVVNLEGDEQSYKVSKDYDL